MKEFRETIVEKMEAFSPSKGCPLKLWVYDAIRYELHPLLRKMWSLKGHLITTPVQRRCEWRCLVGAIVVVQGASEFFYANEVLKRFVHQFLNQISRNHLKCEHVVITNGAGFHHHEDQKNQTITCRWCFLVGKIRRNITTRARVIILGSFRTDIVIDVQVLAFILGFNCVE